MKKFFFIFLIIVLSLTSCKPTSTGIDAIEEIEEFPIEANAEVMIAVYDGHFGEKIIESWEESHPNHKDLISYQVITPDDTLTMQGYDLRSISNDQVSILKENLLDLDDSFYAHLAEDSIGHFTEIINQESISFIPISYDGLLFAYNESLLEELGVDISHKNNGLPEELDSFEKIASYFQDVSHDKREALTIEDIFPFPLNDLNTMLVFLQHENYNYIDGVKGEDIILDERLRDALENLALLGESNWSYIVANKDLRWRFEEVLEGEQTPFTMVGNWMFYEEYEAQKGYNLRFSRMPTLQGHQLKPFVAISGLVANKDTAYPNATQAVLRHIRSLEGIQMTFDAGYIPVVDPEVVKESGLEVSENQMDQLLAYSYSQIEPLHAFDQDPTLRAWELFHTVDIREELKDVFTHDISVESAYEKILKKYTKWLHDKDIEVELDDVE